MRAIAEVVVTTRMILAVALSCLLACGGSKPAEQEQAAQQVTQGAAEVQKAAEQMGQASQQNAAQMAAGVQQMAQGFQQMTQGSTKAVNFEELIAALPAMDGWTRSEPRGEQQSMGFSTSRAEAVYRKDDSRIVIQITDTALNQMFLAPFTMFMSAGYSERSTEGFKRATKIGGHPAFEEWNAESRRGEVTTVVNNRVVVSAKGDDIADVDAARNAVEAVNLGKLASLK